MCNEGARAMNDKQLRLNVIDELDFEPSVNAANIGVQASGGVITLTGHVPDYAQKLAAEHATWRVKGVKAVVQNIAVHFDSEPVSGDEEIAKRAIDVLKADSSVPAGIRPTVHNGWVTLEGEVSWQFQRDNAERDVFRLYGVTGIANNITLKPVAQVGAIKERIEDALKRSAEVEASKIRIEIENGDTVTLEGAVGTWAERMAVQHAAWSAPGVKSVIDHLRIS